MSLAIIILAAGRGVRMYSSLPKVLHKIGGLSILGRIVNTVSQLTPEGIYIVYGYQGEKLREAFVQRTAKPGITWVEQKEQLGTGHAVLQTLPVLGKVDRALILYGDIPLISTATLAHLLEVTPTNEIGLITQTTATPHGLGRILRNAGGRVQRIVEEKDASPEEKKINEINTGFFVVPKACLERWLPKLTAGNNQQEYYLPEIVNFANEEGIAIHTVSPQFEWEVLGVNDKNQLALLERSFQNEQAKQFMQAGVTLLDPARFDVRGEVSIGKEVVIDINVILEGQITIGNQVHIGPNVYIKDAVLQDNVTVLANTVIEGATLGKDSRVGPFARIRPGTVLENDVRVGSFVELKNTRIGETSQANHLSYLGDATLGAGVNVGAGTITCNYDGQEKHKTIIGKDVFIGSDTLFIAPVTIGEEVTIGAGTIITHDIPAKHLVHNRIEHRLVENWTRKKDKSKSKDR